MNKVKIFNSEEFGDVRTVTINGEPWFVGKDVADILGYQNGSRDINRHVHEEDRQNYQNGTFDSPRGMTIINESGLYALIFGSKLESPKVIFANAVETSHTSILIGDLAKLLRQNGVDTGQKRLFEQLRNEGYLMKTGSSRNMPTQRYVADGLFQIKETVISNPDGSVRMTKTTKVTGKGQQYFLNKYLKNKEAV